MDTPQQVSRRLSFFIVLAVLLLSACNRPAPEMTVSATDHPTQGEGNQAVQTALTTGAWAIYQNEQAGYSAEYPADWKVSEQVGEDGSFTTSFLAPDGSAGIIVTVQRGEFSGAGSLDIPNTRCEEVRIDGLAGMRCFDTLNLVESTTLSVNGQTITIASLSKSVDESIYNHFLATFRLL